MKIENLEGDSPINATSGATEEARLVMYQVVAARRLATDGMGWQVPGLALTAQAFLMTIGLGPGTGQLARLAAGLLSVVISLMAVQLLLRHRRNELADAKWLEAFERASGWEILHAPRSKDVPTPKLAAFRLSQYRSYRVWVAGLCVFGLVGLAVAVDAVTNLL